MLQRLLATDNNYPVFIARVTLGFVIWMHGAQKLFGLFGGHGPHFYTEGFAKFFGIPPMLTWGLMLTEGLGMWLLIAGFFGRMWATIVGLIMLNAIYFAHARNGFYMNWYGTQRGEGYEYHLLALALVVVVGVHGSGALSLDRWLARKFPHKSSASA
jgi:putative oxidoreductase